MSGPPPLADLQQWDRQDWAQYDPCLWGDTPSAKRVIQTVVRAADRELNWQGKENANSLRDFWYNPIKPILQRAFPEKVEDPGFDFGRRMSQDLSRVLSDLVKQGELSYRGLNILDESRERAVHTHSPDDNKILFVEKEAAYRKLRPLESVYQLSVVSGGGWQATALIEDLAHELRGDRAYTVYLLTDFDPTGWQIGEDFSRRAGELGLTVDNVRRIGIRPDQLDSDDAVRQQRFIPAEDSDADSEWMAEHAIEGKYGLEIEALGDLTTKGRDLRRLVVDELRGDIRVREHQQNAVEQASEVAAEKAVQNVVNDVTSELQDELVSAVVGVLDDEPGVNAKQVFDSVDVTVDLEDADSSNVAPKPFSPDKLHTGAVDGKRPGVQFDSTREHLERKVQERIDVEDFVTGLDSHGGDA